MLDAVLIQRFWSKVRKTESCWIWTDSLRYDGYGRITYKNKTWYAHDLSYTIHFGCIQPGHYVCHIRTCPSKSCVNPAHLYEGTPQQNSDDMKALGNAGRKASEIGIDNPNVKLTEDQVRFIKRQLKNGQTQKSLAVQFNVYQSAISKIKNGVTWSHITC